MKLVGDDLELQYRHTLENLGKLGNCSCVALTTYIPVGEGGMLGTIFRKAQNKIDAGRSWPTPCGQPSAVQICSRQICHSPAELERLIKMIDKEQWSTSPADVKGDIYEGLLEAAPAIPGSRGTRTSMFIAHAQDVKGGAGQYFTLRPLIDSVHPWSSAFGRVARAQFRSRRNCQAMVEVMQPAVQGWTNVAGGRKPVATKHTNTVADPACGTDGFLLAA